MPRLTWPCSWETPLARWASRSPMTAMLKTPGSPPSKSSAPSARMRSTGTPGQALSPPKNCVTRSRGKRSMPAGTGRVGREDGAGAGDLDGGVEVETLVLGQLADPLQAEEAGVALVGVEHLGLGEAGQPGVGAHGADAADAQQHLLAQPVLGVAAVEAVGDVAQDAVVLLDVGVEQQQRDAAHAGDPDAGHGLLAAGHADGDAGGGAVGLAQQRQRELVGVEDRVGLLLPAVAGEPLAEVAVAVEQPHAHDRYAEVAGGLEVVAGEDAEAAAVLRQHGGDAELGREVGDRAPGRTRRAPGTSAGRRGSRRGRRGPPRAGPGSRRPRPAARAGRRGRGRAA